MELIIKDLFKAYGRVQALGGLCLEMTNGVYGLIGPNGSGKSTLMQIITRNLPYDSGEILCDGTPIENVGSDYLSCIGYMPQEAALYPQLSVYEFLSYMSAVKGIDKKTARGQIDRILGELSLSYAADRRIGALSGGMRQRTCFAQALLGDPRLLILDEPTAGLDPAQRVAVRSMLARLASDRTILLATHVISDIEGIAKKLFFISNGAIIESASPSELLERMAGRVFITSAESAAKAEGAKIIALNTADGEERCRIVADAPPTDAVPADPTLEDHYLELFPPFDCGEHFK